MERYSPYHQFVFSCNFCRCTENVNIFLLVEQTNGYTSQKLKFNLKPFSAKERIFLVHTNVKFPGISQESHVSLQLFLKKQYVACDNSFILNFYTRSSTFCLVWTFYSLKDFSRFLYDLGYIKSSFRGNKNIFILLEIECNVHL